MKRSLYALAAAAVLAATFTAAAHAGTSVDVRVSVGDRYHGATLAFRSEPEVVLVPRTKVYYVQNEDCDLYRYGRYWYFVEDGLWYRSASWRGPFVHVRAGIVPRSVVTVPVRYRRHWNGHPPAHAVARGYDRNHRNDPVVRRERVVRREHVVRDERVVRDDRGRDAQDNGKGHEKNSKYNGR